ncbi:MAG TPA: hypothetical protein VER03_13630 [Bryobacteraceae bacterium]|nr:hypothetical protein [Bryobacteraceae bacterium]
MLRSTMLDGCFSVKVAHVDSEIWAASDQSEDALLLRVPDTVVPGPRIDRIFNAFSGAGFGVSPGSLMTLRGVELGPVDGIDLGLRPANVLPTELGGTQVLFNRIPVHIISVSANQVTFTAPYRLEGTSAALQVKRGEQSSNELLVPVVEANPGILAADFPSPDPESLPVAIARKQDGTLITPSNPAPAGSTVWIYATGLGATNIEVPSGAIATTEALRPAADFREAAGLPSTYGPFPTPLDPSGARAMIGFVNSVFAVPIVVRESGEPNGRTLIRITPAIQTRGASRRSYSPATILYVCKTTQTGSCQAQQ